MVGSNSSTSKGALLIVDLGTLVDDSKVWVCQSDGFTRSSQHPDCRLSDLDLLGLHDQLTREIPLLFQGVVQGVKKNIEEPRCLPVPPGRLQWIDWLPCIQKTWIVRNKE